jgi:hypothetical protein
MQRTRFHLPGFLLLALFVSLAASAAPRAVPDPFSLFTAAPGVAVYGNESEEGAEEYVQVLDLKAGARLLFWVGTIDDAGRGQGQFGGPNPRIKRYYLPDVWPALQSEQPDMLCLANGTFFRDTIDGLWVDPTQLAFPLKREGRVLSEGYERRRFRRDRAMLQLWDDRAQIAPFSRSAFYASSAPNIIVGLDETARVRATEALGRTMVGLGGGDGDGTRERLFIYSGAASTQARAVAVLRAFGAQEVMMLDGGGSAQLLCEGASYIRRVRPLPQMIATLPAVVPQAPADPYLSLFEKTLARWLGLLELAP